VIQLLEKPLESSEFNIQAIENDASIELDHAQEIMEALHRSISRRKRKCA